MRHRTGRVLLTTGALLGLIMGGMPTAAHADPTPPCYGSSCNGKDPHALGCDGSFARTIASIPVGAPGSATLNLRYSDWCHANWAMVATPGPNSGVNYWVENANGDKQYGGAADYTNTWTNMVNGVPLARACAVDNYKYPPTKPGCTSWN